MISGIILAAGTSSRMGNKNKLLLPVEGRSVIEKVLQIYLSSPLDEIVVVTGFEFGKIEKVLAGLPVTFVYNNDFAQGMTTSIKAGLAALSHPINGFLLATADTPNLTSEHVNRLLVEYKQKLNRSEHPIIRSGYDNSQTHPTIFHPYYRELLNRCETTDGCKAVVQSNWQMVSVVENQASVLMDMDTPEDYFGLKNSKI